MFICGNFQANITLKLIRQKLLKGLRLLLYTGADRNLRQKDFLRNRGKTKIPRNPIETLTRFNNLGILYGQLNGFKRVIMKITSRPQMKNYSRKELKMCTTLVLSVPLNNQFTHLLQMVSSFTQKCLRRFALILCESCSVFRKGFHYTAKFV